MAFISESIQEDCSKRQVSSTKWKLYSLKLVFMLGFTLATVLADLSEVDQRTAKLSEHKHYVFSKVFSQFTHKRPQINKMTYKAKATRNILEGGTRVDGV